MKTELILKLKEGVNYETLFPNSLMSNDEPIQIERLNDLVMENPLLAESISNMTFYDNEERENLFK
ncbi:MAG: hypothetical protein IPL53_20685 [Ignavibacteria bacterium]|nr:hypothetical protein [Ignavibacteria bacterium]